MIPAKYPAVFQLFRRQSEDCCHLAKSFGLCASIFQIQIAQDPNHILEMKHAVPQRASSRIDATNPLPLLSPPIDEGSDTSLNALQNCLSDFRNFDSISLIDSYRLQGELMEQLLEERTLICCFHPKSSVYWLYFFSVEYF